MNLTDHRLKVKNRLTELMTMFTDFDKLASDHGKFIEFKQELLDTRAKLSNQYDGNRRKIKTTWYGITEYFKTPTVDLANLYSITPYHVDIILKYDYCNKKFTNNEQRDAVRNIILKKELAASDALNNHITFLNDSITSCNNVIYTLETNLSMYKIKMGL